MANVTVAKPKIGGSASVAEVGTTLPTNAITEPDEDFIQLGYISEDGLTNSSAITVENIKAWGGDIVATSQTEKTDTFQFKLIEAINTDVLKTVYGTDNVTGTSFETGVAVAVNSSEQKEKSWIFDTILADNVLKRMVLPAAKITAIGDIVYKDNETVGYDITLTAFPDDEGNTHYEYLQKESVPSA